MSISTLDDLDDDLPDIFPGEVVHNENGDLGFKIINQVIKYPLSILTINSSYQDWRWTVLRGVQGCSCQRWICGGSQVFPSWIQL